MILVLLNLILDIINIKLNLKLIDILKNETMDSNKIQ